MRKTLLVLRQELLITFKRASYLIFAFVVPLLVVLILVAVQLIQGRSTENNNTSTNVETETQEIVEGYVDQSGLIKVIPEELSDGDLLAYETEAQAQQALSSNLINAYYLIPADYMEKGEIFYVYPESKSLVADGPEWVMKWTLMVNLLGGNEATADRVWNPVWNLETTRITSQSQVKSASGDDCSRPGYACESNELIRFIPSILVALFFISFMTSSNLLLQSIGSEKENRTLEVVLLSVHPRQLLVGKTIGLAIAGLLQAIAWLGAIFILFNRGGRTLSMPENFTFPTHILVWSLVFFLGGYAIYASLFAGVGALVPKMKDAGAVTSVVMLPLLAGYIVGLLAPLAEKTNAFLPVALSLFPLTAPVVMVMRIVDGSAPLWQVFLSASLAFATAIFIIRAVASLFKAQTLLSGQPFSMKRYLGMFLAR